MHEVTIEWIKTELYELDDVEDTYFYMFSDKYGLLYIGMTYYQRISDEVRQSLRRLNNLLDPKKVTIWLGYIRYTTYRRITNQIIRDIECLLINSHRPELNAQCEDNYTGRGNLKVRNVVRKDLVHVFPLKPSVESE